MGERETGAGGTGKGVLWRKKQTTTDVPPGQHCSVPATSRQRGTRARVQTAFVCIQWNCFLHKEDFSCCEADGRRFWPRWNVWCCLHSEACMGQEQNTLLCNGSCLIKNKFSTDLSKLQETKREWMAYPAALLLPFSSKKERRSRCWPWTWTAQKKVRGRQVSEGSNNHDKFFESRGEQRGSSYKQGAFTFGRALLTILGRQQPLRSPGWGARGARKQVGQKGVLLWGSLKNSSLDLLFHPTRLTASLKYLVW